MLDAVGGEPDLCWMLGVGISTNRAHCGLGRSISCQDIALRYGNIDDSGDGVTNGVSRTPSPANGLRKSPQPRYWAQSPSGLDLRKPSEEAVT